MKTAPLPLDRLLALTMEVHRIMRSKLFHSMQGVGVNILQLHGLLMVREHPGVTMKEIARHLAISSPSATVFVARLEEQGYLLRIRDRDNRKIVRVKLTAKGQAIAERASKEFLKAFGSLFALLSPSRQEEIADSFEQITRLYRSSTHA